MSPIKVIMLTLPAPLGVLPMKPFLTFIFFIFFITSFSLATILQESYSAIKLGKKHVGFSISRYEFDPKKKQWRVTSYVKTNSLAGNVTESLTATANNKLQPLFFKYNGAINKTTKSIRAVFSKNKMRAIIIENGRKKTIKKDLPKGTFLSSFLVYMLLKDEDGLKPGFRFSYNAIAEEDAGVYPGSSYIKNTTNYKKMKLYRVLTEFKKTKFTSLLSPKGEAIFTNSPVQKISLEMVPSSLIATKGFQVNTKALKRLFGTIPIGLKNSLVKNLWKNKNSIRNNQKTPSIQYRNQQKNQ